MSDIFCRYSMTGSPKTQSSIDTGICFPKVKLNDGTLVLDEER